MNVSLLILEMFVEALEGSIESCLLWSMLKTFEKKANVEIEALDALYVLMPDFHKNKREGSGGSLQLPQGLLPIRGPSSFDMPWEYYSPYRLIAFSRLWRPRCCIPKCCKRASGS